MANQTKGVTEKLLLYAKKEFLEKGYKDASLRIIAENAGTSTSSIYTRFKDKEGLFNAIVKKTADNFELNYRKELNSFDRMPSMNWDKMLKYTSDRQNILIDIIYKDFSAFKLLVCNAEGTVFSDFIDNIVKYDVEYTIKYIKSIGKEAILFKRLTPELLHMLCNSYWSGVFEIVVHDMDKDNAQIYIQQLKRFFQCGWQDIFSSAL